MMGRTTGRDTQAHEGATQSGVGLGDDEFGLRGKYVRHEGKTGNVGGMGESLSTGEHRGVDDEFMSARDPMMGKQRDVGETYGQHSAREETQRTTGAVGGPPGTAGLGGSGTEPMGGGRQEHHAGGLAGGDIGDDPMMSGRHQGSNHGTGLGNVSGMDSGKRDDGSYGGSYAGGGQPKEKRDSITGKFMEKAGGILGSSKMEEKGHEKREARQRQE